MKEYRIEVEGHQNAYVIRKIPFKIESAEELHVKQIRRQGTEFVDIIIENTKDGLYNLSFTFKGEFQGYLEEKKRLKELRGFYKILKLIKIPVFIYIHPEFLDREDFEELKNQEYLIDS